MVFSKTHQGCALFLMVFIDFDPCWVTFEYFHRVSLMFFEIDCFSMYILMKKIIDLHDYLKISSDFHLKFQDFNDNL